MAKYTDGRTAQTGDVVVCHAPDPGGLLKAGAIYRVKSIMGGLVLLEGIGAYFSSTRFKKAPAQIPVLMGGTEQSKEEKPKALEVVQSADDAAEQLRQLINSEPRTPTKERMANLIAYHMYKLVGIIPKG